MLYVSLNCSWESTWETGTSLINILESLFLVVFLLKDTVNPYHCLLKNASFSVKKSND